MSNRLSLARNVVCMVAVTLMLANAAQAVVYSQAFNYSNGTTNLGDGSVISQVGGPAGTTSVQNNALRLTSDAVGGQTGIYRIPALANSSNGWTANFDLTLRDTAGGSNPADGVSFCLLYTSPSPRDQRGSRMPSSA